MNSSLEQSYQSKSAGNEELIQSYDDEFYNDCWGWEVDIDISETDSHLHSINNHTTSHQLTKSSEVTTPISKDIRISLKPTLSKGFASRTESESSLISRVKSSPSFQELERAIGATLAIGLSDTDISKKEEHVKVINGVISQKAHLKKNIQQRSYNSLRKAELDAQRASDLRNDLKAFLNENESRALLLFHSTDVISFDIKAVCQSFGSLYYFRSDFHSLGLTLLCYFDFRCALDAFRLLPSKLGRLAAATVYYSVILQVTNNIDESQLKVCKIPSSISEVSIQETFSQYGQLKSIQKSFIDPGVSPSSLSVPSLCNYTIEYFNFQDAKVAMSEINSNFTSDMTALPANLVSLGITSAILPVQYDRHQEQTRKELLNLLSTWRTRLHTPLPPPNSSATLPDVSINTPVPIKNSMRDQAVSIHSPGVTVVYPDQTATPRNLSTPPVPTAPQEDSSHAQARGLIGVSNDVAAIPPEVVAQLGLNTESVEARVARHVIEVNSTPAVNHASAQAPPAAATPNSSSPNHHPSIYPHQAARHYFDPTLMYSGYPVPYHVQMQNASTNSPDQANLQAVMFQGAQPGQYGVLQPQYSTFLVPSPYGPVPVTVVSPYASPHGSFENLYALGASYDSEMWTGNHQPLNPHQSKTRNHHQQYHKQRHQQHQHQHQQPNYSSVPHSYDPSMFPPQDTHNYQEADHYGRSNRPPHHNGAHTAMKRSKVPNALSTPTNSTSEVTEFHLSPEILLTGGDNRTTLMIRNIPNKYTQSMLLEEINIKFEGLYDFFYLPIDFKNRCNVGYAFINFLNTSDILQFYHEFHGQRWRNFNSEKVCSITYARIQGKAAMITRFQNSSLLEKDESYKPLLFISKGPDKGKPEPFPAMRGNGILPDHGVAYHAGQF